MLRGLRFWWNSEKGSEEYFVCNLQMHSKILTRFQSNTEKQGFSKILKIKPPLLVLQLEDEQSNSKGQLKSLIDYYTENAMFLSKPLLNKKQSEMARFLQHQNSGTESEVLKNTTRKSI